jgi:hypothetical protein
MNSIWHSPIVRQWRAGWRLPSIVGGVALAAALPMYVLGIALWFASPERIQHAVTAGAYWLYFLTVLPYAFHRIMDRLGFGVLDTLRPPAWQPPTTPTQQPPGPAQQLAAGGR